jgi:hypothetical protein
MNSQSHANAHTTDSMDPMEVIRAATCRESHHLASGHAKSVGSTQPAAPGGSDTSWPGAHANPAAGASEGRRTWSFAAVALAALVAFEAGDSLLSMRHARSAVDGAPLGQVLDLAQ